MSWRSCLSKFLVLASRGLLESGLKPPHPELAVGVLRHDYGAAERAACRDDEVNADNVGQLASDVGIAAWATELLETAVRVFQRAL